MDNDKHILGLIKGCAGWSEPLKVPNYRAKEHMYQLEALQDPGRSTQRAMTELVEDPSKQLLETAPKKDTIITKIQLN